LLEGIKDKDPKAVFVHTPCTNITSISLRVSHPPSLSLSLSLA
jgi:hypothetical protein